MVDLAQDLRVKKKISEGRQACQIVTPRTTEEITENHRDFNFAI